MNEEIRKLTYGSLPQVLAAFKQGAGVFYRPDVRLLVQRIEELETNVKTD